MSKGGLRLNAHEQRLDNDNAEIIDLQDDKGYWIYYGTSKSVRKADCTRDQKI